MRARHEQAVGLALAERARLRRECEDIGAKNARLGTEIERLRQENEALRGSAEIWIRMYENQLARANRASELLAHCAGALIAINDQPSGGVQQSLSVDLGAASEFEIDQRQL